MKIDWQNVGAARWYDWKLGRLPDSYLSKTAGIPLHVISYRRAQLGIAAYSVFETVKPFAHLLGRHSDKYVAKVAGTSPQVVGRFRRSLGIGRYEPVCPTLTLPENHPVRPVAHLLGRIDDADVAKLANVPCRVIEELRTHLNIRKFVAPPGNPNGKRQSAIYRYEHLIVAVDISNQLLGRLSGISQQRVSAVRKAYREKIANQCASDPETTC